MWIIRQQEKLKRDSPSNDPCAHPLNTASLGPFQDRDMISPSLKSTSGIFLLHNNLRIDHVNFREYIHTHRKRKPSHDVRRVHQQRGETSPRAKKQEPRAESQLTRQEPCPNPDPMIGTFTAPVFWSTQNSSPNLWCSPILWAASIKDAPETTWCTPAMASRASRREKFLKMCTS